MVIMNNMDKDFLAEVRNETWALFAEISLLDLDRFRNEPQVKWFYRDSVLMATIKFTERVRNIVSDYNKNLL